MDTQDVSENDRFVVMLKDVLAAADRAARRKGQLVHDHPPPQLLAMRHLMSQHAMGGQKETGLRNNQRDVPRSLGT